MFFFVLLCILYTVCSSISPQQLQEELNAAISNSSINSFIIPSGDYHFIEKDFVINGASNFIISSSSKSIFYLNCTHKVSIINCNNVTINNIYIDFDPPCFSQGIVIDYNSSEPSITMTIDDGYPLPDKSINPWFQSWSITVIYWNAKTRELIPNQNYDKMVGSKKLDQFNKYKIYLEWIANVIPKPNDLITVSPRVQDTFVVEKCANMTFNNLTMYAASNIAVLEQYGYGNNTYNNYNLIRKHNSTNLLTATADGFHSNCNIHGPTLTNSYLEFAGDDFINIHNRMNILLQRIDDYSLYIIDTLNGVSFNNAIKNDYIYFYQLNTQNYIGYGIIDECIKQNNQTLTNEAKATYKTLNSPPYNAGFYENYSDDVVVYFVKFENKLTANIAQYNLVEYDLGNGAVINNNHFYNGYCAMMKLKSKYSIARNNIFEYGYRGILLLAEQSWLEGEMGLTNIIFENNILNKCGMNTSNAIIVQSNANNITLYNNTII